jgi:5-methylcytosine-specific restriction endonuclease McrA
VSRSRANTVRADFERGVEMAELVARTGLNRVTIYQAARLQGWDRTSRREVTQLARRPGRRGKRGVRPSTRAWAEPIREAFEAGVPMDDLIVLSRRAENTIHGAARTLGWDGTARRAALLERLRTHVEGDRATCRECGTTKPIARFQRNRAGQGVRKVCKVCAKRRYRRSKGVMPKPPARPKPVRVTTHVLLTRQLRPLLGKLFEKRCAEAGEHPSAVAYRIRYRTDTAFREREIVRRWLTKERDNERRTVGDGTLDRATLCRLFGEAKQCCYCHMPMRSQDKTLDHIVPLSRGGLHSITNVAIACRSCNVRKHARTPEEWRADAARSA